MYSSTIENKVNTIFTDLRKKVDSIVAESFNSDEAVDVVTKVVCSELSTRSKTILSDMLFDLSDKLMKTDFFSDISKQNKFYTINLRQEILNKYLFAPSTTINYEEASRELQALKIGGATCLVGGVIEFGYIMMAGLSLSSLIPVPLGLLLVVSIGAAVADYYIIEPKRNKKALAAALDNYLVQTQKQFLKWFDAVEVFFNKRVEEIKQTM